MRARLERWLNAIWYEGRPAPWWLRGLSPVYRALSATDRALYRSGIKRSSRPPVPVIVVGNLTVGGSGKTPTVIALVEQLRQRGWSPGVLSRGYGGNYGEPLREVTASSDPLEVGDETVLIALRCEVPVVVSRRRGLAAARLVELGCDLLISDDGLQHHALQRDVELLVIHGHRRLGNQLLLPAGPLRERFNAERFSLRVVNGEAGPGEFSLQTGLLNARRLSDGQMQPLAAWRGQPLHALAGIADPERFFAGLRTLGLQVEGHPFADHHRFQASDLAFAQGDRRPILCTEKDAVKLQALGNARIWAVPLQARLPDGLIDTIEARLRPVG